MTQTLDDQTLQRPIRTTPRPSSIRPSPRPPSRSRTRAGLSAAVWAALVGLAVVAVPVLLAALADDRGASGVTDALRVAGQVWVVGHGAGLTVGGTGIGLTPLGLLALPLLLLVRAGSTLGRVYGAPSLKDAAVLTGSVAAPYAVLATLVAGLSVTASSRPVPGEVLVVSLLLAVIGAGAGVLRGSRLRAALRARVEGPLGRVLRSAGAAVLVLLGAGALLVALSLLLHLGRIGELSRAGDPGALGGLALLLLSASLAPNAVVCAASWLAGPGFAVGTGTAVSPFEHALGPVPSLPLLAALPSGAPPGWAVLALAVPVLAGVLAGALLRRGTVVPAGRSLLEAAAVGPCTGLVMAVLALLAGGSAGSGRLADVGPAPVSVALWVALLTGVPAVLTALLLARRGRSAATG